MQIKLNLQIFIFIVIFILTKQIEIYMYLMFFAFVHELGHLFTGIFLGLKPRTLKIMPFGISIIFESYEEKRQIKVKNFLIAIAGPLTNIVIAIISNILNLETNIIYANILIAVFNLLPIYPLDGGRILKSIITIKYLEETAEKYIVKTSNITIIILTALTSIMTLYFKNILLLFVIIYLWILVMKNNKNYRLKTRIYNIINEQTEKPY